jgi:hypothetical protein
MLGDSLFIWLGFNILFAWNPIYNKKKATFDNICNTANKYFSATYGKIEGMIPRYKD